MTATPTVSPELKGLLRRVKLGKTLDTLPERLTLAATSKLSHAEFLELVLADEVDRRNRQSAALRAKTARLESTLKELIEARSSFRSLRISGSTRGAPPSPLNQLWEDVLERSRTPPLQDHDRGRRRQAVLPRRRAP